MSDDASYGNFLDQANQDTGTSKVSSKTGGESATTKAVNTDVPSSLEKIDQYYTSDADEPFEPVSLKWEGGNMPSKSEFAKTNSSLFMFGVTKRIHCWRGGTHNSLIVLAIMS